MNYNLTLDEYFSLIQQKIKDKDFTIKVFTSKPDKTISVYLEAVNYLMYEYSDDHNDTRQIFPYILIPNNVDWDFTSITLSEFIKFLARNKSKKILKINISEFLNNLENSNSETKLKSNISLSYFDISENKKEIITDNKNKISIFNINI